MELLRTERMVLRHWEDSELPAFLDLYSREEVIRWLGPQPRRALASPQEARERLDRWRAYGAGLDPPFARRDRPGAGADRPGQRPLPGGRRAPGHARRGPDQPLVRPDHAPVPQDPRRRTTARSVERSF